MVQCAIGGNKLMVLIRQQLNQALDGIRGLNKKHCIGSYIQNIVGCFDQSCSSLFIDHIIKVFLSVGSQL